MNFIVVPVDWKTKASKLRDKIETLTADVEGWKRNFTTERTNRIYAEAELAAYRALGPVEELAELVKASYWITVSERLPEEGNRILIFDSLNNRSVTGYYSCPHWEADDARIFATHWMPLPKQPLLEQQKETEC